MRFATLVHCSMTVAALCLLLVVTAFHAAADCSASFPALGASFDLSSLTLPQGAYHVKDSIDTQNHNFTYVFNVCSIVSAASSGCAVVNGDKSTAYQLTSSGECFRLGSQVSDMSWTLLDPQDPTKGVAMKYTGGDVCPASGPYPSVNRSLTINFGCSPDQGMSNFVDTRVVETHCAYTIKVSNLNGCPNECPVSLDRKLCGGNGFCAFDTDNKAPRCFCNQGWVGSDCTSTPVAGDSDGGMNFFLILATIILGVLVIAASLLYCKVTDMVPRKQYVMQSMGDDAHEENVFSVD